MEEWKECKLGALCIDNKGSYGIAASAVPYSENLYTYLRITDINDDGTLNKSDLKSVADENAEQYILQPNDIVFARTGGSTGRNYFYDGSDGVFVYAGFLIKFSIDPSKVNPKYIKYFCLSQEYKNWVYSFNTGSTRGNINAQTYANMPVILPPRSQQDLLVKTLSSLDDKIELNNKINTNLEQQTQALFKNWFVDFEPFGGKMPEGWRVGKLSEYCNFQEGYVNPAQTHNEYFDGDVKWLRAVDINESFILNTSRTLTKCGFESAGKSAFLFKPGSIAISKSGTVGRLGIISDFMCGNRAVIGIELKEQQNLSYIHQYLKSRQTEFPDMAVGSVQKNLYVSILENLDIIIPSKEVLEKYAKICMPFYDQIKTNCVENNNLSSIRDTLLPKVMNGEIEV